MSISAILLVNALISYLGTKYLFLIKYTVPFLNKIHSTFLFVILIYSIKLKIATLKSRIAIIYIIHKIFGWAAYPSYQVPI